MQIMRDDEIAALRATISEQQAALDALTTLVEGQGVVITALLEAVEELTGTPVLRGRLPSIENAIGRRQ
jgi:hypothetical protein